MRLIIITIFFVSVIAAQENNPPDPTADIISALISTDAVQQKFRTITRFVDLKVRFLKLTAGLLSRENLIQLRRILDFVVRVCEFVMSFLPEVEEESRFSFLEVLFPALNLNQDSNRLDRAAVNLTEDVTDLNETS